MNEKAYLVMSLRQINLLAKHAKRYASLKYPGDRKGQRASTVVLYFNVSDHVYDGTEGERQLTDVEMAIDKVNDDCARYERLERAAQQDIARDVAVAEEVEAGEAEVAQATREPRPVYRYWCSDLNAHFEAPSLVAAASRLRGKLTRVNSNECGYFKVPGNDKEMCLVRCQK